MGTWSKFAKPIEWIESESRHMFYKFDSVEFLENYEVILAKFSSSCIYMLSLS